MLADFHVDEFLELYGLDEGNDKSGKAIKFKSQDSEYRVYIPIHVDPRDTKNSKKSTVTRDKATGNLKVVLAQDHEIGASTDDHSFTYVEFNPEGTLIGLSHDFAIKEGSPLKVPDAVVDTLSLTINLLGALAALETGALSEVVAKEVIADIKAVCQAFNAVTKGLVRLSDDGGRVNFPAIICHNMNKAACSVHG